MASCVAIFESTQEQQQQWLDLQRSRLVARTLFDWDPV